MNEHGNKSTTNAWRGRASRRVLMQLSIMDFNVEDDQNMELKRHTQDRSSDLQPIRHLRNGLRRAPAVGFEDSVEEGVEKEWRWWWW